MNGLATLLDVFAVGVLGLLPWVIARALIAATATKTSATHTTHRRREVVSGRGGVEATPGGSGFRDSSVTFAVSPPPPGVFNHPSCYSV